MPVLRLSPTHLVPKRSRSPLDQNLSNPDALHHASWPETAVVVFECLIIALSGTDGSALQPHVDVLFESVRNTQQSNSAARDRNFDKCGNYGHSVRRITFDGPLVLWACRKITRLTLMLTKISPCRGSSALRYKYSSPLQGFALKQVPKKNPRSGFLSR